MVYKNLKHVIDETMERTVANIEVRGHEFVEGFYRNRKSELVIFCPKHNNEHVTTFWNYNRSKLGCPKQRCGRQLVSEALTGRTFTEATLEKMAVANSQRPNRGGKHRKWRKNHTYFKWRMAVQKLYNNKCAITGAQNLLPGDLVAHHLNSANEYPDLIYVPENGIILKKELHVLFHKTYGYGKNTVSEFQSFLILLLQIQKKASMPISNQANLGGLEGSETRAYDPARVMKLHECLERGKLNK